MLLSRANSPDVLMIIKTQGLIYDDRLRKEVITLSQRARVEISCVERGENRNKNETVYGCVQARAHKIRSRIYFPPGKGVALKAIEVIFWLLTDLFRKRPRVAWIHDPSMIVLVLSALVLKKLGMVEKVVWDQHELPRYLNNSVGKLFLRKAINNIDSLICTNKYRLDYLIESISASPGNVLLIENYPDSYTNEVDPRPLPDDVLSWLDGQDYFLAQGGGRDDRYHSEVVEACESVGIRLVIIGNVPGQKIDSQYVYYTGQIPQLDIIPFTDNCLASIILYQSSKPNTLYCSPNRLFQAIGRKKPVLVGSNPPMKEVIEETNAGVVLDTDGAEVEDIVRGMKKLLDDLDYYKKQAEQASNKYIWEAQDQLLLNIIG